MKLDLMKPTIHMTAKNPQLAVAGRITALVGGGLIALLGILQLLEIDIIDAAFALLVAAIILTIELDTITVPEMKKPHGRGVVWLLLGILAFEVSIIPSLLIIASGVCYLIYFYN